MQIESELEPQCIQVAGAMAKISVGVHIRSHFEDR